MFTGPCRWAIARLSIFRSPQRGLSFLMVASSLSVASLAQGADLSQAVVREKHNVVTLAPNLSAEARPAPQGAVVQPDIVPGAAFPPVRQDVRPDARRTGLMPAPVLPV